MNECTTCGAPVSARFARVYGDNQDDVYGCPSCMRRQDLNEGGAAQRRTERAGDAGNYSPLVSFSSVSPGRK